MIEKKKKKLKFTVKVRLEQAREEQLPDVTAYAFDTAGQFLAAAPLPKDGQGEVKLELPPELADTTVRVVLGPRQVEEKEEIPKWMDKLIHGGEIQKKGPSLSSLVRKGGYEKRIRLDAEESLLDLEIFQPDWKKWLFCPCNVRGRLVKRIPLPDGTTQELGVCNACVKIYEVDKIPGIILHLPERDLFRLRDDLFRLLDKPLPGPPEILPPPPSSPPKKPNKPVDPMPRAKLVVGPPTGSAVASPVIPLPPPKARSIGKPVTLFPRDQLRAELEPILHTASASQLRNQLIARAEILEVYICALDWLWYRFHTDLIKCVCTDEQGRFETAIRYRCTGDKPDLYFKVVQCIGGNLHTLYDPGVACHTHWNYVCGTEVMLETTDPAAITCTPPDLVEPPQGVSLWVMPWGIGSVRLDQIQPSGLTGFSDHNGTWVNVPFGGQLGFRLGYSSDIPYALAGKPAYYRWLYNQLDNAGNETEWREFAAPVALPVVRHYIDYALDHPELPPTFPVYPLGPQEKNSKQLYEFKPHQPPVLTGHKREWPVDDWFMDINSGILQSTILPGGVTNAAGKYKIKIEVYDKDGNLITPGSGTFDFILPNGLAADGMTILTRKADPWEIEGNGFVFYLHVDNNKCEAEIYEASVNSVASGPCGFIAYEPEDDVDLSFKAYHPNDFARFKFTVVRGSSGYVTKACSPATPGVHWANAPLVTDAPVNGFSRNASSVFVKDVNEAAMRGGCAKAAFGENLYVAALATNGWVRLSELDASALPKTFALEPKTT